MNLALAGPGESFLRDGDGDEQEADQRAGHAGTRQEEVVEALRRHIRILAGRPAAAREWYRRGPTTERRSACPVRSRCSPVSGRICHWRRWRRRRLNGASTVWSSRAG